MTDSEYEQAVAQQLRLRERRQAVDDQIVAIKLRFQTGHGAYRLLVRERASLVQEKNQIEAELRPLKAAINAHRQERERRLLQELSLERRGRIDEYDLANALAEPQHLLQQAYARLLKLTTRVGVTDADRGLIDAIHAYLHRNGMVLDREARLPV